MDEANNKIEAFTGENTEYLLSNTRFTRPTKMKSLGLVDDSDHSQLTLEDYAFLNLEYPKPEFEQVRFLTKIKSIFRKLKV